MELKKRLPKTSGGLTTVTSPLLGDEWQIKLSTDEEHVVCNLLHTAAYCSETAHTLEKAIHREITPAYADQVRHSLKVWDLHFLYWCKGLTTNMFNSNRCL